MKQKLISIFVAFLTIVFVVAFSYNMLSSTFTKIVIPSASNKFYVNDFADIITDDEENWLAEYAEFYYQTTGITIVISTIESTNGRMLENYAVAMFNQYQISDLGLLILYSKYDDELCIKVGSEISPYISDNNGPYYISRDFAPFQKQHAFYNGFRNLQKGLMDEIITRKSLEKSSFIYSGLD